MFGKKPLPKKEGNQKEIDSYKIERSLLSDAYFQLKDTTNRLEEREGERRAHLAFMESMDKVNRAVLGTNNLEQMMRDVLGVVLSAFDSDRAWLFYPCDPDALTFRVPMEVAKPEYPGAGVLNVDVPMPPDMAENLREILKFAGPQTYISGTERPINKASAEQFGVKSQMMMALYPKAGMPWAFGVHQCSYPRVWTNEEKRLFEEIGRRLGDALTGLLISRNLFESEERFRRLAENARDVIYRMSLPDGKYEYMSPASLAVFGYSPEEFYKTPMLVKQLVHPDWSDYFNEQWKNLIIGEVPPSYEYQIVHKSGGVRWLNQRNILVRDKSGAPIAIEGIVTDISERKLVEGELLRASEDRYKALFLSSRDAIMTLEPPSWKFTSGNPATLAMFKEGNEGAFLASEPWKLSPEFQPDGRRSDAKAKEMIEKAMSEGHNFFEWTHRRSTGEDFPAEVLLSRVEQGDRTFLHAVVRDITERKLVEAKLKEYEEEKFKVVFDNANDGMVLADVSTQKFSLGNRALSRMLGYSAEEIKKLSIPDIHPKEALPLVLRQFEKQSRGELAVAADLPVKRKDGSVFYADISASPVMIGSEKCVLGIFRDITERKAADEALRRSENFLNKIIENIPNMIFVKDVEALKFTRLNKAGEELLGYSEKDMMGKNDYDFWPKEQADFFTLKDREMLQKKELVDISEEKIQTKNKGERILHTIKLPVLDDSRKPLFVLGISEDITERKKGEVALRLGEEKLRRVNRALMTISEANQVSIRAVNEDKLLRDVCDILVRNAGYKMVWVGYAQDDKNKSVRPMAWAGFTDGYIEKLNVSWADVERGRGPTGTAIREKRVVLVPDFTQYPDFRPWLEDAKKQGYVGSAVLPLSSDGHVFGAISIYAGELGLFDADEIRMLEELAGDLAFSIVSIRNRVEKEKADDALLRRTQELQQFQAAVTNASDHIVITDPNAKILYANKGAEFITGYPVAELIGKTPAVWGSQMPSEFYAKMWRRIKEEKLSFVGEISNKRKSGEVYDAEISISPILDDRGNILYFVGVERDITKAKEIDRSKSEFVSLASHQLRTPLSAINWYTEMLLGGDAGPLSDKQREYATEVYSSSRRMAELVSALLNVSRIELGTFAIEPKPTNIIEIADSILNEIKLKIEKKKQIVTEEFAKNIPMVDVDPNLTRMILQNLITNSVKYTQDGGKITISISTTDKDLVLAVADNGYGIPIAQQGRVYQKFFRADNIVQIETDGTGLGLYMVKEIVEKAGGTIRFESAEGKGTTFYVTIPLAGMIKKEGSKSLGT